MRTPKQPQPPNPSLEAIAGAGAILTTDGVAAFLRCHKSTVYRLIRSHQLEGFKIGSDYRFSMSAVLRFIQKAEESHAAERRNHPDHEQ